MLEGRTHPTSNDTPSHWVRSFSLVNFNEMFAVAARKTIKHSNDPKKRFRLPPHRVNRSYSY